MTGASVQKLQAVELDQSYPVYLLPKLSCLPAPTLATQCHWAHFNPFRPLPIGHGVTLPCVCPGASWACSRLTFCLCGLSGLGSRLTIGEEARQIEDLPPQHIGPNGGGHWLMTHLQNQQTQKGRSDSTVDPAHGCSCPQAFASSPTHSNGAPVGYSPWQNVPKMSSAV